MVDVIHFNVIVFDPGLVVFSLLLLWFLVVVVTVGVLVGALIGLSVVHGAGGGVVDDDVVRVLHCF